MLKVGIVGELRTFREFGKRMPHGDDSGRFQGGLQKAREVPYFPLVGDQSLSGEEERPSSRPPRR